MKGCIYSAFVSKTGKCPVTGKNCKGCFEIPATDAVVASSELICSLDTGISDHQKAYHNGEEHKTKVIGLTMSMLEALADGESVYIGDNEIVITLADEKQKNYYMPDPDDEDLSQVDPDDHEIPNELLLGYVEPKKTYTNEQLIKDKERIAQEKLESTKVTKAEDIAREVIAEAVKKPDEEINCPLQREFVWPSKPDGRGDIFPKEAYNTEEVKDDSVSPTLEEPIREPVLEDLPFDNMTNYYPGQLQEDTMKTD